MMGGFFEERRPGRVLVGVLLLVAGLVCLVFVVYSLGRDISVWVLGRQVDAEVIELAVVRTSGIDEQELTFDYYVTFRFTTPDGQSIVNTVKADVREWGALNEGGPVSVVYFPLYPAHNRLDDSRFVSLLACSYLPLMVASWVALGIGLYLIQPGGIHESWFAKRAEQSSA
jgi:hypothetical protein